jgi:biotin-[acetyl-CoA-carboxylase] ligase BirA-like protein
MKILSDNINYSQKLFPSTSGYTILPWDMSQYKIYSLLQDVFHKQLLYQTTMPEQSLCEYALVTHYAPASQFRILREHAQNNLLPGTILCLADSGQGFSGYRNRTWTSVHGNLHLSVFLKPDQPVDNFETGFTMLSTVSTVQAINDIDNLKAPARIRWINDIFIGDAKVGGVLTHTFSQGKIVSGVILGIGINVETKPEIEKDIFVPGVISLFDCFAQPNGNLLSMVLHNLLKQLTSNYRLLLENRYNDLLNIYRTHSIIIGKLCSVYSDPLTGNPEKLHEGKIVEIGKNLELHFDNRHEPIRRGRIIIQ